MVVLIHRSTKITLNNAVIEKMKNRGSTGSVRKIHIKSGLEAVV